MHEENGPLGVVNFIDPFPRFMLKYRQLISCQEKISINVLLLIPEIKSCKKNEAARLCVIGMRC